MDAQRFARCWTELGAHGEAYTTLVRAYAEPHRHYHDAEHIAECLAWLDRGQSLATYPRELELAIYFHDVIYEPLARDNEARSATLFRALAQGGDAAAIERVASLILSTARHEGDGDAALLSDIDLSILGASPTRYARFERDVRAEYAAFDDEAYRRGRSEVLHGFLQRVGIYKTAYFSSRLEAQARDNLAHALAALR